MKILQKCDMINAQNWRIFNLIKICFFSVAWWKFIMFSNMIAITYYGFQALSKIIFSDISKTVIAWFQVKLCFVLYTYHLQTFSFIWVQEDMVCLVTGATGERVGLAAEGFGNRHCFLENIADKVITITFSEHSFTDKKKSFLFITIPCPL